MILIENLGKILIIFIIAIIYILIIIMVIEKKLRKRMKKKTRNTFYMSEIEKIDKSYPKKTLESIDQIARSFFEEAFKIRKFTGYSELKKSFNQKNNLKAVEFCELMTELLYSGEKNSNKNQRLINLLMEIVKTNKIISKEEQIKTEKNKRRAYSGKMKIFRIGKKKSKNKKNNRKKD